MTLSVLFNLGGRRTATLCLCTLILAGCGGGQFGSKLSSRPRPQPIRDTQASTLRLPADHKFSIVLPKVSKAPGLDSTATADCNAQADGQALALASITGNGLVESQFQIGHAVKNATELQADLDFRVRFRREFEVTHSLESPLPDAVVGLRLYVQDHDQRTLRDLPLIDLTTEHGAAAQSSDTDVRFTITLEPGGSLDVFLAGRAKVEIPDDRTASASASLKLSGLEIEIQTRPAPPVRVTDDERK